LAGGSIKYENDRERDPVSRLSVLFDSIFSNPSNERKSMKRFLALVSILVLSFSLLELGSAQSKQKAPDFTLRSADGKTYQLSKMHGKVVVVNFWATWCPPCKREIPDLIEVFGKYRSKGLEIVGIALDQGGWNDVTPFLKQNKINYPIVVGDDNVSDAYGGITAIPTTFIIDKNGYIVDSHVGMMTKAQLEAKIKHLL
jgi:thiol-disulfide isomerase/thioredoxin